MSAAARAVPIAKRGGAARTFVLCPWTTVRGNSATAINLVQDRDGWLDLAGFNDATFVVDIANVTNPSGASPGYVLLYLESSPAPDETAFKTVAGPIVCTLTPASSPILAKTASAGAAAVARFVRWRITASGSASVFDVTMRIRVAANRSFYFAPTQFSGCLLWLRADLGVSFSNQSVSSWADWSGNGNNASQGTSGDQPTFSQTALNGWPALVGNGSTQYLITNSFAAASSATLVSVVQSAVASQNGYVRILEQKYDSTYYLGVNSTGAKYKVIVDNPSSPYGLAEGGTVSAGANVIVSATYASPTGAVYVNGTSVASDTFSTPMATSQPMYVMNCYNGFSEYWNGYLAEAIVYNRKLSTTEFTQLHRYLGARYGISVP